MEKLHDVMKWFTEHGYLIPFAAATVRRTTEKVHWTRIAEGVIIAVIVGFVAGDRAERAQDEDEERDREDEVVQPGQIGDQERQNGADPDEQEIQLEFAAPFVGKMVSRRHDFVALAPSAQR